GVFDVKKTYLHLYPENTITLDVRQPLPAMGGRTALQVARDSYKKHVSQQKYWFYVTDDPKDYRASEINCSKFGLFRTTVGNDTGMNEMTENIITYEEEERLAEEKRQEEIRLSEEADRASSSASIERERLKSEAASQEAGSSSVRDSKKIQEENDSKAVSNKRLIIIVILLCVLAGTVLLLAIWRQRARKKRKRKKKRRST
ncbi:MAG: hypothetical protein ILP08_01500, partial [Lachnospiraceae bacterium]|nr:hypothetical protein [Lachnospiraceae bacterium]